MIKKKRVLFEVGNIFTAAFTLNNVLSGKEKCRNKEEEKRVV